MKPPIEYRAKAKAAPKRAAKAVESAPAPKPGGQWVWVPDGKAIELRDRDSRKDRMRDYMRKRRAEAKS